MEYFGFVLHMNIMNKKGKMNVILEGRLVQNDTNILNNINK